MVKKCPFNKNHLCELWIDYQVNLAALDEAIELCSANWKEIMALQERIDQLESALETAGVEIP